MVSEAIVLVKVNVGAVDKAMSFLKAYSEVREVASTAGHYDLIVRVVTDDLEKLHDFVTKNLHLIDGVQLTETHLIAKKI